MSGSDVSLNGIIDKEVKTMGKYSKHNRFEVANQVAIALRLDETYKEKYHCYPKRSISEVCDMFSIFDWWTSQLSHSQIKQMEKFLKVACDLGYNGYVCFKVGVAGCAHGMWAYKEESTDGFSPDCEFLYHSFRNGDNYWDIRLHDGRFGMEILDHYDLTLAEVKELIEASESATERE